jgi:trigger factor
VSSPECPEIDDSFAEKYNSNDLADLRAEVETTMGVNVENSLSSINRIRVFDALVSKTEIDVPRKLVQEEVQRMVEHQKEQMQQRGMDPEVFDANTEALEPEAKKRVSLGLIMMQYIQDNEIKVDDVKVQDYVAKMASGYEDPAQFIAYYNEDRQRLAQIESIVLETQVVEHLIEGATVSEDKVAVKDLLDGKVS